MEPRGVMGVVVRCAAQHARRGGAGDYRARRAAGGGEGRREGCWGGESAGGGRGGGGGRWGLHGPAAPAGGSQYEGIAPSLRGLLPV